MSKSPPPNHPQTEAEEWANAITHGIGAALSVAALAVMVWVASRRGTAWHVVTCAIFGVTLIVAYAASTGFHLCREARLKHRFRMFDHVSIYFLIAGTYTPFLLVSVRGGWGWSLFCILWALAVVGTWVKIRYTGEYDLISTAVYVGMGWIGLIAIKPFLASLPGGALEWILIGGAVYTVGVIFYAWEGLPFNHAIWHLFVMGGSLCHFIAVFGYVLPS